MTGQFDFFNPIDPRDPSKWVIPEPIVPGLTKIPIPEEISPTNDYTLLEAAQQAPTEDLDWGLEDLRYVDLQPLFGDVSMAPFDDILISNIDELPAFILGGPVDIRNEMNPKTPSMQLHTLSEYEGRDSLGISVIQGPAKDQPNNQVQDLPWLQPLQPTPPGDATSAYALIGAFADHHPPDVLPTQLRAGETATAEVVNNFSTRKRMNTVHQEPRSDVHRLMDLSITSQLKSSDLTSTSASSSSSSSSSNDGDGEASLLQKTKRTGRGDEQRVRNNSSSRKSREKKARVERENEKKCNELENIHTYLTREKEELRKTIIQLHEYHSALLNEVKQQRLWRVP